ncbi:MAG: chlorite dismutase family protein [Verrucomicrobiales bacterium]
MDITRTAYGTWSGGRFMHFGEMLDEDRYLSVIQRAYESGIRTFMTADVYGVGEADTMLGKALAGIDRSTYCLVGIIGHDFYDGKRVGSKGYPRFTDPSLRGPEGYASYMRMAAEKELERCGTDRFDCLMLHNPDSVGYLSEDVWAGMRALKEAGLTEMLGIAPGPANGFTIDLVRCFEKFGADIDWAMIILNPLEPWPGKLCLKAAEANEIKVMTRVVDHGGLFHGDVQPGHHFRPGDHRTFRPAGWVEHGCEKIAKMASVAERHGLTTLQFACQWNLAQPAVESVIPTLIQEAGEGARPIEDKVADLAALPAENRLTAEECAEVEKIGDNKGCMALKGATRQFQGPAQADQWQITPELEDAAARWGINPDRDLYYRDDPRDLREKAMPVNGVIQASDSRLYLQLQVFTGATPEQTAAAVEAVRASGLDAVVYANANDPRGIGVLLFAEDPDLFAGKARDLLAGGAFADLEPVPDMTMVGRTYGFGREPNLQYYLTERPFDQAMNPDWPWAVWYPLRRSGSFYRLPKPEQMEILKEHGMIGFRFGDAGYAGDIRLECFGIDRDDNEFLLGLMGPRLDWLSKLVATMRPTVQTSQYIDKLGPFFVGRVIYQSRAK